MRQEWSKKTVVEVNAAEGDIVLFIDEIHTLVVQEVGERRWMRPTSENLP
jgi:ATP-dependent Clp protease ATP-binding subunit ClpA